MKGFKLGGSVVPVFNLLLNIGWRGAATALCSTLEKLCIHMQKTILLGCSRNWHDWT